MTLLMIFFSLPGLREHLLESSLPLRLSDLVCWSHGYRWDICFKSCGQTVPTNIFCFFKVSDLFCIGSLDSASHTFLSLRLSHALYKRWGALRIAEPPLQFRTSFGISINLESSHIITTSRLKLLSSLTPCSSNLTAMYRKPKLISTLKSRIIWRLTTGPTSAFGFCCTPNSPKICKSWSVVQCQHHAFHEALATTWSIEVSPWQKHQLFCLFYSIPL